jgi:hypothetical protein
MGRSAHVPVRREADHPGMDDCGILHRIEDDMAGDWIEAWAGSGVLAIESYLAKHLAFLSFLEDGS